MKLPACELCGNPASKSSIIGEFYYRHICLNCYAELTKAGSISSGHAHYARKQDQVEHEADIMQPYNGDGSISAEFIHLYPERAREMWSQDEMDQATRS
jgi:hypothetical protein